MHSVSLVCVVHSGQHCRIRRYFSEAVLSVLFFLNVFVCTGILCIFAVAIPSLFFRALPIIGKTNASVLEKVKDEER